VTAGLYTAAMLAKLVSVPVARIRSWQRRGWIVPTEEKHRLAYFDFIELTVARQLAGLQRAGASPKLIAKKLVEIQKRLPDVRRPLAELSLVLDGRTLLVRRDGELLESGGQLRIDFDALDQESDETPATIVSPAVFLSRGPNDLLEKASPEQFLTWASEMDEAGDLRGAAEMYRSAMALSGPQPELCFHLAEALYRSGDLTAARERYFEALELDEDYVEARVNLGCVLLELKETELAVAAFSGALESHEEYADAHYHLGETLDELGRTDEATAHWERFLELAPNSPWSDQARERLELE